VDIGVLEEVYSSEWASLFPSFEIPKKNGTIRVVTDFRKLNLLLKHKLSPISYSKNWIQGHDPFNGRVFLCFSIGLKYGLLSHQNKFWMLMLKIIVQSFYRGYGKIKIQIQSLTHRYQHCLVGDIFQNIMSNLVQEREYFKTNLIFWWFVDTKK
jgi:hypothetical protein